MEETGSSRRGFLSALTTVLVGIAGAALAVPAVVYLGYPRGRRIVETPEGFLPVARLSDLPADRFVRLEILAARRDAWTLSRAIAIGAVWARRQGAGAIVFSTACPHLACDVQWRGRRFECPCHASAFGPDGARVGGPARRGLDALEHRVNGGVLEVKYRRFRPGIAERLPV